MTTDRDDNLTWLAYQYVANELDAAQRHDFETRLASDQAARDAVADVVLIHQALADTPAVTDTPERSTSTPLPTGSVDIVDRAPARTWSGTVVAVVTALSLLILAGVLIWNDPAGDRAFPVATNAVPQGMTAARTAEDASSLIVLWHDLHADQPLDPSEAHGLVDEPEPAADAIPDWMFVALNASTEAVPALDEMDMDNSDGPWPAAPAQEQL